MNCLLHLQFHLVFRSGSKMNLYVASLLLVCFSQILGEELSASQTELKEDILKKLRSPNDTLVEADAKDVIAEYLVLTVSEDLGIVAFGRDKDRDRDRATNKPARVRPSKPNRHKPSKPHIDNRYPLATASPIASNNNNVGALSNPAPAQPVGPIVNNSPARQDAATQVPILNPAAGNPAAPAGGNPAAAPAGNNPAATAAPVTNAPAAVNPAPAATAAPVQEITTSTVPGPTRPTVSPEHVYNQVDKILGNVATGNIVGIVDESLAIRAPVPVRNFVTGILKVIFCNPIDRIFGRCRPNSSGAISSVQGR